MGCACAGSVGGGSHAASSLKMDFKRTGIRDMDDFLDVVEKQLKLVDDICDSVDDFKMKFMDATGLDEVPGAKIKHALRGLVLGLAAAAGDKPDSYEIKFSDKKPFVHVRVDELAHGVDKVYDSPKWEGLLI
jgi:hypothetical protein